jgi:hypothetical protein
MTSDVLVKLDVGSRFSTPVDKDAFSLLNEIKGIIENATKAELTEVPTVIVNKRMN